MEEIIQQYLERNGFRVFCPKAVLFDMDGVLYDSMSNHAYAWHTAMKQCGMQMDESEAYLYEGMRGVETIKLKAREQWNRELSDEEAQQMYNIKSQVFAQCSPAKKMAGVEALMQEMQRCGLRLGVVTGSGQRTLLDHLEQEFAGLLHQNFLPFILMYLSIPHFARFPIAEFLIFHTGTPKNRHRFSFFPQSSTSPAFSIFWKSKRESRQVHLKTGVNSVTLCLRSENSLQSEKVTFLTPPASEIPAHSMLTVQIFIFILLIYLRTKSGRSFSAPFR